ncbi:iron-containing alcohol dehydrogenase family protein [Sediminispirochaeta smaragdinae]|uniref:Iron-containing alcohol dehydrogenase n=1 Tax=Sediminispirochaeta smaragdinae (strain DSM 11293 / JCM 15392 / SEBR 4228) TaxID=573413 RepID=E1R6P4_SEDSS|nr:iron-containing alcohol dehydrogenase [Sediminispirochaeta smaragdinae]ADK79176.1 iron-containing alcohol dehydrogenase [Sediminispirochaeta smaragdinae DSM 11293]
MKKAILNLPTALYCGRGCRSGLAECIPQEAKVALVTDKGLVGAPPLDLVTTIFDEADISWKLISDIDPNPDEETVLRVVKAVKAMQADVIVAIGGGSPLDTAKAAACMARNDGPLSDYQWEGKPFVNAPLPLYALPTTAGTGSEVTGVAVITSRNMKKGINAREIFPKAAFVDPELMIGLPPYLTAITGMDALTHAIEAYVGLGANPFSDALCEKAIELIADHLPRAFSYGGDIEAREAMGTASSLAGLAMDQAGLGIVHSLSSPVCAYLHVSHGLANAMLLPHGMRYNLPARHEKFAVVAELMGYDTTGMTPRDAAEAAVVAVEDLLEELELGSAIEEVVHNAVDFEEFGNNASKMFLIRNNPRGADSKACRSIFETIF